MKPKARENLRAARALLDMAPPCSSAAATRAYYAVYHAGWFLLEAEGYVPPDRDGRRYWRHDEFGIDLLRFGIVDEDGRELVEHLKAQRMVADYYPDEIPADEARQLTEEAAQFLETHQVIE